jgi:hypothetical protein
LEDRRNVGENSCNSGKIVTLETNGSKGPILEVYDDNDDDQ